MTRTDQWKSYLLGHHEFREIATDDLFVDTAYQRDLNESAITRYVNGFDANMFEPLTVNERKNGSTKPTYALLDGQHRKTVAQKLGMKTVTCRVLRVDAEMEAQLFIRLNKDRIHLSQVSAFKAELAAKNPAAIEIRKCLKSAALSRIVATALGGTHLARPDRIAGIGPDDPGTHSPCNGGCARSRMRGTRGPSRASKATGESRGAGRTGRPRWRLRQESPTACNSIQARVVRSRRPGGSPADGTHPRTWVVVERPPSLQTLQPYGAATATGRAPATAWPRRARMVRSA